MQYLLMTAAALALAPLPVAAQSTDAGQHQSHQNHQPSDQKDAHAGHGMTADCCSETGKKAAKTDCCKKADGKGCCDSQKATAMPEARRDR